MSPQRHIPSAATGFLKEKCSEEKGKVYHGAPLPAFKHWREGKKKPCLKCMLTIQIFQSTWQYSENFPFF